MHRSMTLQFLLTALVLLAGFAVADPSWALSSDKEQSIHIEADSVNIDEGKGVSTYTGNVTLKQGSIQVWAARIVVHTENRQLVRIIADGQPAKFQQTPDDSDEPVRASAQNVEYNAKESSLLLTKKALFVQGPNQFSGDRIEYDMKTNIVQAKSTEEHPERIQVIIKPSTIEN